MKKFKSMAFKIVLYSLGAVLVGGGAWWGYKLYKKTSNVEAEIDKVSVSKGDIEIKFQDIGDIAPKIVVQVYARVGGSVDEVLVKEGDSVEKGAKVAVVQPGQSEADKFLPVEVLAPIGGTVMRCESSGYNSESELVKPGQRISGLAESGNPTCLIQIADLSRMMVKLNVSEMEVNKLKTGMPVKVSADALPMLELSGRVAMISPKAEKDNRSGVKSFRVEVGIDQKNSQVRPGMTARIETVMEERKNILKMPISGLFEERGKKFAYLDVPQAKARKVDVRTGLRNETEVEILSGLAEGSTVYTDKPLNLQEDMPAVKSAAAQPAQKGS